MSHFPIEKDDMLAAFADGKIPSAYYWQTLITGMYDTATDVADLQDKHAEVVQYYNYILELSNTIDTHYNQIEIWHGKIDVWQQAVSQNAAITEANKTESETLLANCRESERLATNGASQATASASAAERYSGDAAQSKIAAEQSETNAKVSQQTASLAASNSTQSSIISVEAKEAAEAAATQAQASQTVAQSSASEASASKDATKNSEIRASNEADRSKLEADRSLNEADRAEHAANSVTDIPDPTGHEGQWLGTDGKVADWYTLQSFTAGMTMPWPCRLDRIPNGWLHINHQLLQIAEYQGLFDVMGNVWGGDGVTTFQLPPSDVLPVMAGTAYQLGQKGGANTAITSSNGAFTPVVNVNPATLARDQIPSIPKFTQMQPTGGALNKVIDIPENDWSSPVQVDGHSISGHWGPRFKNSLIGGAQPHTHAATCNGAPNHTHTVDTRSPFAAIPYIIKT